MTSTVASPGNSLHVVNQALEGNTVTDLAWGTAYAKPLTVSFWVYTSVAGTYCAYLNNANATSTLASGTGYSYVYNFTVSAANTWTQVSYTIPGFTNSAWKPGNNNNGIAFVIGICLYMGGTVSVSQLNTATNATWMTDATTKVYYATTAMSNTFKTSGNTFYFTGFQVEKGSLATPFEFRPYAVELALCQRYFNRIGGSAESDLYVNVGMGTASATGSKILYMVCNYPVAMRTVPTVSYSGTWMSWGITGAGFTSIAINASGNTTKSCQIVFTHNETYTRDN